jgi:signal transduction histidine kinase
MPTDLDPLFAAGAPPLLSFDARQARDEMELIGLRATVASLLEQIRRGAGQADLALAGTVAQGKDNKAMLPHAEFVSMLAHELRNPLQSMAMASQLLATTAQTQPLVAQAHNVLNRQITHMSRLLDDLLDASRAASGKIILQLAPVSLREVINAAIETRCRAALANSGGGFAGRGRGRQRRPGQADAGVFQPLDQCQPIHR